MDWLTIICFVLTWLITFFGLKTVIKELREALKASGVTAKESADFMMAIATMLEDGKLEPDEMKAVVKEYQEMVAAGQIAGKEWKDVFDAILDKFKKK